MLYKPDRGIILIYLLSPFLNFFKFGGQSAFIYLNAIIVICYFIAHIKTIKKIPENPFFFCILLVSFSFIISNYYGYYRHTPIMISNIFEYFSIFVVYDILRRNPIVIFKFAFKVILIMAALISVNGFLETITRQNILFDFLQDTGLYDKDARRITEVRFGLKRAQSAFTMHTSLGGYCLISFTFLYYLKKYCKVKARFLGTIIVLLGMNLFFTGARSAIVGFTIAILTFIKLKDFKSIKGVIGLLALFLAFVLLQRYLDTIFNSIFYSDNAGIGSDTDMRNNQFDICTYYFLQSPIIGHGISYIWEVALPYNKELFGAESLWMPVMVDQGILGIVAVIFIYLSVIRYLWKSNCKKFIFVPLGYLVFNSMSSIPGFSVVYLVYYAILLVTCQNEVAINVK